MKSLHSISYRAVSGLCKMLLVERQKVEGATPLKPKLQRLEMDNLMKIIIYRDKSSLRTLREPRRGPLRSSQDRFMKRAIIKAISSTRGLYKIFYLLFEIKKERSWIIFSHLRRLNVFRAGGRVRFGGVSFLVLESLDGTELYELIILPSSFDKEYFNFQSRDKEFKMNKNRAHPHPCSRGFVKDKP